MLPRLTQMSNLPHRKKLPRARKEIQMLYQSRALDSLYLEFLQLVGIAPFPYIRTMLKRRTSKMKSRMNSFLVLLSQLDSIQRELGKDRKKTRESLVDFKQKI